MGSAVGFLRENVSVVVHRASAICISVCVFPRSLQNALLYMSAANKDSDSDSDSVSLGPLLIRMHLP